MERTLRCEVMTALVAVTLCACSANYGARDVTLEVLAAATLTADAGQTFTAVRNCGEINPVIGSCGQRMPVVAYFVTAIVAHAMVSRVLPKGWWRTTFQSATIGVEASTVYWNRWNERMFDRERAAAGRR